MTKDDNDDRSPITLHDTIKPPGLVHIGVATFLSESSSDIRVPGGL